MIASDPFLLVRAASLYVVVVLTLAAWAWRRPDARAGTSALLGFVWNLPVLFVLNVAAARFDWWIFSAKGGVFGGMPVETYLAWAWLWGAIPVLALPATRLAVVLVAAFCFDLVLMPLASPLLILGDAWLVGEVVGLLVGLLPAQLLARWTVRDEYLHRRALLQVVAFTGLLLIVLPAIAIEGSGSTWVNPLQRPTWLLSLMLQVLAVPALLGVSAVQEFVEKGRGTPVPFDPPRRLVTTGVYAYVRNPMQLAAVVLVVLLGLFIGNLWLSAAGVMAHVYSIGLAGWDEDDDLGRRFGGEWLAYRREVPRWLPRWRPWHRADEPHARLLVSETCVTCRGVGLWFRQHHTRRLEIVPAELDAARSLTRITYEPADGGDAVTGVEAVARALEHIHVGWAFVGSLLRLPGVKPFAQLLADASGGEPRATGPGQPRRENW